MTPEEGREVTLPGYSGFVAVAKGGDSVVYRARQDGLGRDVAVKVVLLDDDPATVARFRRELEITVRLGRQHPNIVTVIDTGTVGSGQPCLVMEYYDRGSLHDRLQAQGPFPIADVIEVGKVVADALAFAHGHGVLHRDVKPQNILVLPTSYMLADFGLARGIDAGHSVSLERFSYRHAAPQILDGGPPTVLDDVYSLGSTLFTLLDGRPPFSGDDPESDSALSYIRRVRSDQPRQLSRLDLPAELAGIVMRCLSGQRSDRFPDAASVRAALGAIRTEADAWAPRPVQETSRIAARMTGTKVIQKEIATASAAPQPEPARPAPVVPVATSALAHLDGGPSSGVVADQDLTGAHQPALAPPEVPPPAPRRPSWRRFVAVGVIAVAVGTAAGVLLAVLRGGGEEPVGNQEPSIGQAVPTFGQPVPQRTGIPQVDVADPKISPVIQGVEDRRSSVILRWSDPSDGTATFVVTRKSGNNAPELVARVPKGTTQWNVEGLDPTVSRYCFQVIAIVDGNQKGASAEGCTPLRKAA